MLHTVLWHRDRAAAAYLELEYDPKPWEEHAQRYAAEHKLMLSPLLPLMAFRLAVLARERPTINATIVGERRYQYRAGEPRLHRAGRARRSISPSCATRRRWTRRASSRPWAKCSGTRWPASCRREEATGATLSFSSMARWNVSRHIPDPAAADVADRRPRRAEERRPRGARARATTTACFPASTSLQVLQALSRPPA